MEGEAAVNSEKETVLMDSSMRTASMVLALNRSATALMRIGQHGHACMHKGKQMLAHEMFEHRARKPEMSGVEWE